MVESRKGRSLQNQGKTDKKGQSSVVLSRTEKRLVSVKRLLASYIGPVLQVAGTLLVGYGLIRFRAWSEGIAPESVANNADPVMEFVWTSAAWPLWVGAALSVLGPIVSGWRARNYDDLVESERLLTQRCSDLDESYGSLWDRHLEALQKLVDQALWRVYNEALDGENERRVSVYRHTGSGFSLVSRCSIQPAYRRKGRTVYPDDQGVIGLAWERGDAELDGLPDCAADSHAYFLALQQQGIERATAESMAMKSRHLIGIALLDSRKKARIGVLIAESTRPKDLDKEKLSSFAEDVREALNDYLEARGKLEISVNFARKEGF